MCEFWQRVKIKGLGQFIRFGRCLPIKGGLLLSNFHFSDPRKGESSVPIFPRSPVNSSRRNHHTRCNKKRPPSMINQCNLTLLTLFWRKNNISMNFRGGKMLNVNSVLLGNSKDHLGMNKFFIRVEQNEK